MTGRDAVEELEWAIRYRAAADRDGGADVDEGSQVALTDALAEVVREYGRHAGAIIEQAYTRTRGTRT